MIQVISNAHVLEVLNHNNYENWRLRVETYLLAEDLWEVVEAISEPTPNDDDPEYKSWKRKNAKALYAIQNSCGPGMFSFISEIKSAKTAWEALEQECKVLQGYDENNADHLVRFESFIKSVNSGDWDKAKKCLGEVDVRSVVLRTVDGWLDGTTTLHVAASEGHGHIVKELVHLMSQEDLKTKTASGHTALHLAADMGHVHVVKELPVLSMGEVKDKDGDTALHIAVQEGKVDVVKELVMLMREEDLKIKNDAGYTALHLAVKNWDMPMIRELVEKGRDETNIGEDDFERYIPFTTFVTDGDWGKANECLKEQDNPCGAATTIDPRDDFRDTALHVAARKGHLDVTKGLVLLLKTREKELELKTAEDFTTFRSNITSEEVGKEFFLERAKYMVDQYEKTLCYILEMQNSKGRTALLTAALNQKVDIVKELAPLMRQEGLEMKDADGDTALHIAVAKENIDIVKELAHLMRQEGLEMKDADGDTALHIAVSKGNKDIVKELMPLTRPEALEEKDGRGYTILRWAIKKLKDGDVCEIAKYMAEKNDKVFGISSGSNDEIPVVQALVGSRWEVARCLYSVTPLELIDERNGIIFICYCLDTSTQIDLAWDLLHRYPSWTITVHEKIVRSPMLHLSRTSYAFLSGTQLTHWQRWIYNRIHIGALAQVNIHDISLSVAPSEDDHENKWDFLSSVINLFRRYAQVLRKLCGIHRIYEMKSTHKRIFEILRCMGEATINDLSQDQLDMVKTSFFKAIQHGHFEFVIHICKANPQLMGRLNADKGVKGIFHTAIQSRQKEVYSLIHEIEERERRAIGIAIVKQDDSLLHYAANLSSLPQFDHIQDAGLQMQRELQWFKEVESIVPPEMYDYRNSSDMTARELFTKNHKKLMDDAEISIKGTATSCTVVGALIVTMMFAAAFSIPGGNDGNTGRPLLQDKKLFTIYIVSTTISLVSSTSSVITFLGILTSRYAENDFLKSLPTKIMIGLITLFSSVVSMMIAFSCALIFLLDGKTLTMRLCILFTSVPVILFVWLLFPLLIKTLTSTYGPGIFVKRKNM